LDHGYFFFAPNPGPSHLLRARLEFADGRPPQEITWPDRNQQWPRLLYHRHFMISEQFQAAFAPPVTPATTADAVQLGNWQRARGVFELWQKSIERHLREKYGAQSVTLTRIQHLIPSPAEFATQRAPLTAPGSYIELPDTETPAGNRLSGPSGVQQ
jgi:hypothetical protein